jgi:hypothetical protein
VDAQTPTNYDGQEPCALQMKIGVYSNMIRIWSIGKEVVHTARFPPGVELTSATTTSGD